MLEDRRDAGRLLATELERFRSASPIVLGLSDGGVPVAFEVAQALKAPLDAWVVRKVVLPDAPGSTLGAVA
jgi:putative phosphoribosyl transferase